MPPETFSDFTDIEAFLRVPRLTSLTATSDGSRVVAVVQQADEHGSRMVPSLWELDPAGKQSARRLTRSAQGESGPRFAADGSLLFISARPVPDGKDGEEGVAAVWRLPRRGEAQVVAAAAGGLGLHGVAVDGTVLATTSVLAGATLGQDAERRAARTQAKATAIWHTGMPVRYWDHELGDTSPRLVLARPGEAGADDGVRELVDVTPRVDTLSLLNAEADLSNDGTVVVSTWQQPAKRGETTTSIVLIDLSGRPRRRIALRGSSAHDYSRPRLSPDGSRMAVTRFTRSTPTDTTYDFLEVHPVGDAVGGEVISVDVGDLSVTEYCWAPDGSTLFVAGDLHSRGAVLAVDPQTGRSRTLADDAVYSSLAPTDHGRYVFALRSANDSPARPVRLPVRRRGEPLVLPAPGEVGPLPGRMEWVETEVAAPAQDGAGLTVGGWLCTPHTAHTGDPAPVMLWVHGGPHGSYNGWSWRWCPWLAVARGYAVLLPDPAMSTGYGHQGLNRGWPRRPDVVWRECETLLDKVLRRPTLDASRTALLGASFGGFMTNWVAGHTERFAAIVTHAGLWALDQQHVTTDAAAHKVRVHGDPQDLPQWYAAYSPHRHAANISTPMLVTHGTKDYRVPVSEALRLWWDLVSGWAGRPKDLPHRFLELTSENHWVLTPSNARIWNEVVLGFCDQHVLGREPLPDQLPW